jgi:hypothetical protein
MLEGMDENYNNSQGPQWSLLFEKEKKELGVC